MDQNSWQKSEGNPPEVPTFIKDGSTDKYHNLYKISSSYQCMHGRNMLGMFVRIASTVHEFPNVMSARIEKQ